MDTSETLAKTELILQKPPEKWSTLITPTDLKNISPDKIKTSLKKDRAFKSFIDSYVWEISLEYDGINPTIVLNAYTGEIIDVYGPLN
jgi:uncharacterized membrane protein YkoI